MSYKGRYKIQHPEKYVGDYNKVTYRSLWELKAFQWVEKNPDVYRWNSEEVIVPYICRTDGAKHRYFMDLMIEFTNGVVLLVEIKPEKQTRPPQKPARQSKRFIAESMTYAKNISKWEAAQKYAEERGWKFQIWSEKTLESLGIKILNNKRKRK